MSYDENRISDLIDGGLIEMKNKMTKKENLFQEHYTFLLNLDPETRMEPLLTFVATDCTQTTLAYHKKCLELILEEWTKGKFQEPLNAIIKREIEELK